MKAPFQFDNIFEPEEKDKDEEGKSIEHLNDAIKAAKKCLQHGDFNKYKDEFQKAYDRILVDMLLFTHRYLAEERCSLEMYAVKMIRYMQRVQDLRLLLSRVELDANKPLMKKDEQNGQTE